MASPDDINTDNLTPDRVERMIDRALFKFGYWERRVDLENPAATDHLYRDYQIARERALLCAASAGYQSQRERAARLP